MKISIEKKKAEAIERMKALGIFPQTIEQFKDEGFISIFLPGSQRDLLSWLSPFLF